MRIFRILLFFITFLLPLLSINAEVKIDLTKNCESEECKPRIWFLNHSFSESFLSQSFKPDANWKIADSFPIWLNQYFPSDKSIEHYSLYSEVKLPAELLQGERTLGIRFGEIGEVFSVYVNGNKILEEGEVKGDGFIKRRTVRGVVYPLPKSLLKSSENQILIHIIGDPRYNHTGLYITRGYTIGYYDSLKYEVQDRISLALILVYIVVGFYHLFLYLKRRKEKYNLFFGIFSAGAGIYFFTRSNEIFELGIDSEITQKLELVVLYLFFSSFFQFFSYFYFNKISKFQRYLSYFHIFIAVLTIISPLYFCEVILRLWQGVAFLLALPSIIFSLILGVRFKANYSRNLLFGTIIMIFSAVFDILDSLVFNMGIAFSKYAFFIYIMGIATVLADKFSEIHRQTEFLNVTLERKVKERTQALSQSLESVKELKSQQDGDYFLTSLLLKPLGSNLYRSKNVNVQFYLQQKKKFQFKQWNSEIGGDLCVTNTLVLKNREYTVFVNADAMGKSIQGAGGVLVLGSVFAAIIERTKMTSDASDIYPERWLKNSFLELQKVFETFDGSMLVSLVLGLIEDDSGNVYYINAEHPSLVLYRDGKASFLDKEMQLRKLGIRIPEGHLSVRIFQLKKHDVLISGSDGRDDLLIPMQGENKKIVNEDETKFLHFVEQGNSNLNAIAEQIQSFGDLTDDLSMLRIEYLADLSEKIVQKELWENAYSFFRKRKFMESYELCMLLIKYFPMENKALFLASMNKRMIGDVRDSADMAERVRLRETENIETLLKLAFTHLKLKNYKRVNELLIDISRKSPANSRLKQLQNSLKKVFVN
ncbi:MAG: SpoIIE family protein phosphatase [Leptospira sp.]|nr:SpoIIE family protein phosphatase [Leptospira sp.]